MTIPFQPAAESAEAIAIVGMACRFPEAADIEAFWDLLRSGREAIARPSEAQLLADGADPALVAHPDYVRAFGVLEGADLFDATFFGMSPREAEITDPQQRLFLECAWTALEEAAMASPDRPDRVGVFAGAGWSSYLLLNLATHDGFLTSGAAHQAILGNDKDNLTTRVSYKLDLTGPSVTVQTGCSTSLVAVGLACQSLLEHQCDLALAGGVSVLLPQHGHLYRQGGTLSHDGRCRAFDAEADGTVLGSGVGVVVLRRLEEALADGDQIHAVIRSVAVNNDGGVKAGYTAPSVEGQARVITEAHALAGLSCNSISYVEAHGTGTNLGDPIELAGLARAFRSRSAGAGLCAIGSVKTNIGHLDAAAGIASLIKTALALKHRQIPPSLHLRTPNPAFDWAASPFCVNTELTAWTAESPRRAGVSSFGLGGTNAHAVLEEAPEAVPPMEGDPGPHLLVVSAKTAAALAGNAERLAAHLRLDLTETLADVARTLATGRGTFDHRGFVVAATRAEAAERFERLARACPARAHSPARPIAFLFSGQGIQPAGMARGLAERFPAFRANLDDCLERLLTREGLDLRPMLFAEPGDARASAALRETCYAQPALFVLGHALARQWIAWGIAPQAVLGHSLGEITAAMTAGILSLDDALALVARRGRLMQEGEAGAMLVVARPESEVRAWLGPALDLAAVNAPDQCIISGPVPSIAALRRDLEARGIPVGELTTSRAFHSRLMDPVLAPFRAGTDGIALRMPALPFLSTLTGMWLPPDAAPAPDHWVRHLREPVRFAEALQALTAVDAFHLVEIGPGRTLCGLATRQLDPDRRAVIVPSLPDPTGGASDAEILLQALGTLWQAGAAVTWSAVVGPGRQRVHVPTYAFDRKSYFVQPARPREASVASPGLAEFWRTVAETVCAPIRLPSGSESSGVATALEPGLDALCLAYVDAAATRLDLPPGAGPEANALGRVGVIPRYCQLAADLLSARARHDPPSGEAVQARLAALRAEHPDEGPLLDLVSACGASLTEVLTGGVDPRGLFDAVLDPNRPRTGRADRLRAHHAARLRDGLAALARALPDGARLRILEIGGGTGIATSAILPVLPRGRTSYTFSDLSPLFLDRARRSFRDYPFVDCRVLDINAAPGDQGFAPASYDIVIAVNVLHIARRVDEALARVRSLLAPGGLALLWETTRPNLEFGLTYGLLMEPLNDGSRSQGNPFLSRDGWVAALAASGFAQVAATPNHAEVTEHLFVAQAEDVAVESPPAASAFVRPDGQPTQTSITALPRKSAVADWFYAPSWRRVPPLPRVASIEPMPGDSWVIFADPLGLGARLAELVQAGGWSTVTVLSGIAFAETAAGDFVVRPHAAIDYVALLDRLKARGLQPRYIVHLWSVAPDAVGLPWREPGSAAFVAVLELVKALGSISRNHPVDLTLVTTGVHDVTGEEPIHPHAALMLAAARVVPLEFSDIACRAIDLPPMAEGGWPAALVTQLAREAGGPARDRIVAYRGVHRWVPAVGPVETPPAVEARHRLRADGVYLITGGCGTIGLTIAEHMASLVPVKLVLTGRSAVLPRSAWAIATGPKDRRIIDRLRAIEAAGSEVEVVQADVANLDEMRRVVDRVRREHGPIAGVIHSAGVLGDGTIQQKSAADLVRVLAPKVEGTLVLERLFAGTGLDFLILFSSLSSLKPGFGQVAYAAANSFVDAFAWQAQRRKDLPVTCIGWDVWRGEGMAFDAQAPAALRALKEADIAHRGIAPHEGTEAFDRALASRLPHVLVCTTDYLANDVFDLNAAYLAQLAISGSPAAARARPELAVSFAAASSPVEARLAAIWRPVLGIERFGIDDDFFDLGGDSLIGMQVLAEITRAFDVTLKTTAIFTRRTIRDLARAVEDELLSRQSPEALGRLLATVEAEE